MMAQPKSINGASPRKSSATGKPATPDALM